MNTFSDLDINRAKERGITSASLNDQWERLKNGFPFIKLEKAAIIGEGIRPLSENQIIRFKNLFDSKSKDYDILKFVPASGAATRMFKAVRELYEVPLSSNAKTVLKEKENFPFYPFLKNVMESNGIASEILKKDPQVLADLILTQKGLGYNNAPKGVIPFDLIAGKGY